MIWFSISIWKGDQIGSSDISCCDLSVTNWGGGDIFLWHTQESWTCYPLILTDNFKRIFVSKFYFVTSLLPTGVGDIFLWHIQETWTCSLFLTDNMVKRKKVSTFNIYMLADLFPADIFSQHAKQSYVDIYWQEGKTYTLKIFEPNCWNENYVFNFCLSVPFWQIISLWHTQDSEA